MISFGLLFFLLIFIVGFVFAIVFAARSRKAGPTDPICGKCSYQVRGLTRFTCPECGSDVREVGIISAAAPARARHGLGLGWKLFAFIGPWGVFGIMLARLRHSEEIVQPVWAIGLLIGIVGIVWWHSR